MTTEKTMHFDGDSLLVFANGEPCYTCPSAGGTYSNGHGSPVPLTMESLMATMRALPKPPPVTVADITAAPDLVAKLRRELPAVLELPPGGHLTLHEDPRLPPGMWHEGAPFAHIEKGPDGPVLAVGPHTVMRWPPREPYSGPPSSSQPSTR